MPDNAALNVAAPSRTGVSHATSDDAFPRTAAIGGTAASNSAASNTAASGGTAASNSAASDLLNLDVTSIKVDLHVHSKYSDRPSEWILRRIGAPESFVEPVDIYRRARQRGMRFVTISDHNCIDGALEIAHLPDTFLSTEVTTYFPEDGCKIHCLVSGITEEQFRVIQEVRRNIYDFRQYVIESDIVYSVAHPLFRVNDQLTVEHVEKLLVMFNRFEGINGTRDPRASELVSLIFRELTPTMIADMADRHGLEPLGPQPWHKTFTGGSDDHSGIYIASAYTQTPAAETVEQFLAHIRAGRHEMGGSSGTSLRLAHSFYHIAYDFYKARLLGGSLARRNFIDELFRRVIEGQSSTRLGLKDRLRYLARRITARTTGAHIAEQALVDELSQLLARAETERGAVPGARDDQHSFYTACRICHLVTYEFFQKLVKYAGEGRLVDSLQTVSALGPVALSIAPYLAAFRTQHKDERFLQAVAGHFEAGRGRVRKSDHKAFVTDTFADVNGVSLMLQCLGTEAKQQGREMTVVTSGEKLPPVDVSVHNFAPVGSFALPEYEMQQAVFPPFLEVIEYLERERFGELVISTPGPMGLTALAAGRLLGIPLSGIYHTDFPQYVRLMTQDEALEQLTWRYMHWFYDQMQTIYVPSEFYRRHLVDHGFDGRKMKVLKQGIDVVRFSPAKRDSKFFPRLGAHSGFTFLYVGRVSKEKNLDLLFDSFLRLDQRGAGADLAIVGDGPYLGTLRRRYERPGIFFTGFLGGETLARAFASADVFVFPSTTDTFGNVVLEAQASGLPSIVSNQGGPAEVVEHRRTGLIFDAADPDALLAAMESMRRDESLRALAGPAALENALSNSWSQVLDQLWTPAANVEPTAAQDRLLRIRSTGAGAALMSLDVA